MTVTIESLPNITAETIQMLTQYVNGMPMDTVVQNLWDKYRLEFSEDQACSFRQQAALIHDVSERILKNLGSCMDTEQNLLQFFFQSYTAEPTGETMNLAQSMVLTFLDVEIQDFEKQMQCILRSFHDKGISYIPQELCSGGMGMEDQESYLSKPLVHQIQELPYPPEFKWNLNLVLSDFDYYLKLLADVLRPCVRHFQSELKLFEPALRQFEERWTSYFEKNDVEQFARQFLNMDEAYGQAERICVIPWIFGGNIVGIDKGDQGQVSIHIGILIQTFFRVARVPGSSSQICKNLRALGDINKFEILQYISGKQAYGMELAKEFSLTTATISKHMSMLRACGLINVEKRDDNRVYFSVNQQAIVQLLDDVRSCLIK